ncbi:hypothetical protein INT48_004969 [Thamnidium elegans]|uniref:MTOR-associated protein MEAK7 n=1 Tax=Thamnidium elegans TaxID=101142 RepID=A0A8H7SVQ2_9FUNG|nr:hypothetical protein INT48_004969 [Thamnidium elegans]
MGNQQSHSKDKTSQLWSAWTPTERTELQARFDSLNQPPHFSTDLYHCILPNLKDISQYLEFAKQVLKSKDTRIIYTVFQYAVEKKQASLETFVSWVVKTAIPIWFENGSGYSWSDTDSSTLLEEYILNYAHEQDKQKKDDMAWLYEDSKSKDDNKNIVQDEWKEKVSQSPSKLTETEFIDWIKNTPAFIGLFQVAIQFMVMGKPEDLHKSRLDHTSSPQIQKHNKETKRLFDNKFSSLINPFDYYMLTLYLPHNALSWTDYERTQRGADQDVQHDLLFSSRRDGMSWQNFANRMVGQGATLTIIKAKDGSLFGAYADEAWEYANTDWYGNSSNFLFRIKDKYGAWLATNANNHYQYLCWGKKSLPNGFAMGGQFEYAGLWIDSDFIHGHSRAGPLCTTYSIWLVRPLQKDPDADETGGKGGVLSHAEDMEFMEMAGKKMYSKDLGPEPTNSDQEEEEQG